MKYRPRHIAKALTAFVCTAASVLVALGVLAPDVVNEDAIAEVVTAAVSLAAASGVLTWAFPNASLELEQREAEKQAGE